MDKSRLYDVYDILADEAKDLYVPREVERIQPPTPIEFLRDYVSKNRPVIIQNAINHWPALSKWTNEYLQDTLKGKQITVAVTPNGRADAITTINDQRYFVLPEERSMPIDDYFAHITTPRQECDSIMYIQKQNSSLTDEYEELLRDVDNDIDFATAALGRVPDAVNIWIGTDESSNNYTILENPTVHKDQYENMYAVVSGEKHFTLMPPTDRPFLYVRKYPVARFRRRSSNNEFDVIPEDDAYVPWVSVDPDNPDLSQYPLFEKANVLKCAVRPGEILYLPTMWYHQVSQKIDQTGRVIAVNYWYDQDFDVRYVYFRFLESLVVSSEENDDDSVNKNDLALTL